MIIFLIWQVMECDGSPQNSIEHWNTMEVARIFFDQ